MKVTWCRYTRGAWGCQEMDGIVDSEFECPVVGDKLGQCCEMKVVEE